MNKAIKLSLQSKQSIENFIETNKLNNDNSEQFIDLILNDVKNIKDCSESSILSSYLLAASALLNKGHKINDEYFTLLKRDARSLLANLYTNKLFDDNIDIYFNEVKREYIKHPMNESDDLQFLPENRDVFIKNNLKLVIECAKRYLNLGIEFDDLIQAGNYGLLLAFEKFDTQRANLKFAIINDIKNSEKDKFTYIESLEIVKRNFTYSKSLDLTLERIPKTGFKCKDDFIEWANKNIKTAIFASVAFQWIRAYILIEIDKYKNIVKAPKSNKKGVVNNVNILRLDSINPHTDDSYHDNLISDAINEQFIFEDEEIERKEHNEYLREVIDKLFTKLSLLERRIMKKRFGIGIPYLLSISEIAEAELLSTNRVKYIILNAIKVISENVSPEQAELIRNMI